MPIDYTIDPATRRVLARGRGSVTDADVLAFNRALLEDPDFDPGFGALVDLSAIEGDEVSSAGLEEAAAVFRGRLGATPGRIAVVASSLLTFGMARMYQIFADDVLPGQRVFRTREAAEAWLAEAGSPSRG